MFSIYLKKLKKLFSSHRYQRHYSKRNNTWSAVPVKVKKDYSYINDMLRKMIKEMVDFKGPLPRNVEMDTHDPRRLKRSIAISSPPPTRELAASKKSRFQ